MSNCVKLFCYFLWTFDKNRAAFKSFVLLWLRRKLRKSEFHKIHRAKAAVAFAKASGKLLRKCFLSTKSWNRILNVAQVSRQQCLRVITEVWCFDSCQRHRWPCPWNSQYLPMFSSVMVRLRKIWRDAAFGMRTTDSKAGWCRVYPGCTDCLARAILGTIITFTRLTCCWFHYHYPCRISCKGLRWILAFFARSLCWTGGGNNWQHRESEISWNNGGTSQRHLSLCQRLDKGWIDLDSDSESSNTTGRAKSYHARCAPQRTRTGPWGAAEAIARCCTCTWTPPGVGGTEHLGVSATYGRGTRSRTSQWSQAVETRSDDIRQTQERTFDDGCSWCFWTFRGTHGPTSVCKIRAGLGREEVVYGEAEYWSESSRAARNQGKDAWSSTCCRDWVKRNLTEIQRTSSEDFVGKPSERWRGTRGSGPTGASSFWIWEWPRVLDLWRECSSEAEREWSDNGRGGSVAGDIAARESETRGR